MAQATLLKQIKQTGFNSSEKENAKREFCNQNDLKFSKKTPLVCISYALSDNNRVDLIQSAMEGILEENVLLAITAIGTQKYQDYFTQISERYPSRVVIVSDAEEDKKTLYSASDMLLLATGNQECDTEIQKAMYYGVVPLSPANAVLTDYNPNQENGNAFIQKNNSHWGLFANFIRALENFKFPYDWRNIVKSVMN